MKEIVCPTGASAAEPIAIRSVVPELSTSIISFGTLMFPPVPVIRQRVGSDVSISAPKALHATTAERVSPESRGLAILDVPSAKEAMTTARMVWDLEAGRCRVLAMQQQIAPRSLAYARNISTTRVDKLNDIRQRHLDR